MEIYVELADLNEIRYIKRWLRWLIASLVGIAMVYISEPENWAELHQYDGYLWAMAMSCGIAIALSKLVNYASIWLDKKATWVGRPLRRLALQLCFGIVLPIGLAVAAIWYYFMANNLLLSETTYFTRVFYPICLLLLLANGYYPLHFYIQLSRLLRKYQLEAVRNKERLAAEEEQAVIEAALEATLAQQQLEKSQLNLPMPYQIVDVALVISIDRVLIWFSVDNEKLLWYKNIAESIGLLPINAFYKINKSCIVARGNIAQAFHYRSKTIELLLRVPDQQIVIVSQRAASAFTKWYGLRILPERPKQALSQAD